MNLKTDEKIHQHTHTHIHSPSIFLSFDQVICYIRVRVSATGQLLSDVTWCHLFLSLFHKIVIFVTLELLLFDSTLDVSEKSLFCMLDSFCCFGCFILKGSPFTDSLPGLFRGCCRVEVAGVSADCGWRTTPVCWLGWSRAEQGSVVRTRLQQHLKTASGRSKAAWSCEGCGSPGPGPEPPTFSLSL